jgi:hypothetical protein
VIVTRLALPRGIEPLFLRLFTSKPWVQGVDGRRRREGAGKWLGLHVATCLPLPSPDSSAWIMWLVGVCW